MTIATSTSPPIKAQIASGVLFDEFYNPNTESNEVVLTNGRAGCLVKGITWRLLEAGDFAPFQHLLHQLRSRYL